MQRTHIYLPNELNTQIELAARLNRKSKAEIINKALQEGLKTVCPQKSNSAKTLLKMARAAKSVFEKSHSERSRGISLNPISVEKDPSTRQAKPDLVGMTNVTFQTGSKKFVGTGHKDLSANHDYYTWGGPKRGSCYAV